MSGKAKLPVRWRLKSPIRRTAKGNGNAIEQQTRVPVTSSGEMPELEGPQERIPAPSLPGSPLLQAPSSPHGAQKHKRTRPTTVHSRSKEDPACPEPVVPPGGVGQARSRFPLRGLQTLAKNFTRKGPGRRRRNPSEQQSQPRETDEDDDDTLPPQDSDDTEPVQEKDCTEVLPQDEVTASLLRNGRHDGQGADDSNPREAESTFSCEVLDNDKDRLHGEGGASLREKMDDRRSPRIVFIGVFLNGIAVALASFVPAGGADARPLVKALLLQPSTPILPGGRYTACESTVAVHMVVDHKTRVYACVTADDVPLSLAFSLLEEVQIQYLFSVSTLAFSTAENTHSKRCHAQICQTWAKFERVERSLEKERETRRRLGEEPLDIEAPLSRDNKIDTGAEVVPLNFDLAPQSEALAATCDALMRASTERASGGPPAGTKKGLKFVVTSAAGGVVLLLAIWAVRSLYLTH